MESVTHTYTSVMSRSDPRVEGWLLMSSPFPTLAIVGAYLLAMTQGPRWMKDKPALSLKPVIILYNFFLVCLSAFMFYEFIVSSWLAPGFSMACQRMDYSQNPQANRLLSVIWWFYFSKIIELMDSLFFLLRKKNNQLSFLHVYHHSTMPLFWWAGTKFVGGGEAFFSASINCGIHVLMYLYYMLSSIGPAMQPYLWWKKYITTLQLIQFWAVVFKTSLSIYLDCGYPNEYLYTLIAYVTSHIVLFSNFYYHTYSKKTREMKRDQAEPGVLLNGENNNGAIFQNGDSQAHLRSNITRKP